MKRVRQGIGLFILVLALVAPLPAQIDRATISGTITDGGDTTPPDLQDAPRKFVFTVKTDDGQSVTLTYTDAQGVQQLAVIAGFEVPTPDAGKILRVHHKRIKAQHDGNDNSHNL